MARQITNVQGIADLLCLSRSQVYKLVGRQADALPHRKLGKVLRFDVSKCLRWFDLQPGKDLEEIEVE